MASSFNNESPTINDLMKKSTEISSGPPAVRRLITTRSNLDESGKIRKWIFGQQNAKMQNKTILMVGETGTGKTILINTMVNYYLGVKFEDKVWFEITEEQKRDQTESQTSEITVYEIFSEQKSFSLSIVDTPGYGNTRGIDKDMEIPQNLCKLFLHDTGVKDLDAVCLVLKASQNIISERQHYIFDAILSLFGKDIGENIVLFITHSDGSTPINALKSVEKEKIPCCHDAENQPVHFLFNNCQSEIQTAKANRAVKMGWEMWEKSLQEFFEFLQSRERKGLIMTVNVLQERMQLDACVQNLKEHVFYIEAKQRELNDIQCALRKNKEKIEKNVNHRFTVRRVYKGKVDVTGASWWGQQANKYEIREEIVTFEELNKYSKENDVTYDESAFRSVKTKHEKLLRIKEELMNLESSLKELLTEKEKERNRSMKEAYETIIELSEIALKPDSAFTLGHLEFLIPRVEEAGEAEWAQKLKNLQKDATTEPSTTSTMWYLNMMMKNLFSEK